MGAGVPRRLDGGQWEGPAREGKYKEGRRRGSHGGRCPVTAALVSR